MALTEPTERKIRLWFAPQAIEPTRPHWDVFPTSENDIALLGANNVVNECVY